MTLLLAYLALALVVSFFCSISEAVLLSVRPSHVEALHRKRVASAAALRKLQKNLDRPLAAILTLNTVAHTVGAAGVGAQAAVVFGSEFVGLTSAILTLLILILSEIVPKTLGAVHWRRLAPSVGHVVLWLTRVMMPFVWLSERLTRVIARSGESAFTFSRDEMRAMAEIGAREGVLDDKEHAIVSNLMRLHRLKVEDIMTPASVMTAANADLSVGEFFETHADTPFSRLPVYAESAHHITGYVLKSDLLLAQARGNFSGAISEYKRDVVALRDDLSASAAFDRLTRSKGHLAMVVDEFGTLRGLITMEDVVETLLGLEITDEADTVEDMQILARERWRERMAA
ncbi:hemolysin family protein, partial [Maricaulis sp.]|uniref:CNNM domain-containing protein n=1 Tax=Maricaulis sp. TaxID=1486257 RepID=UPI00262374B4